MLKFHNILLTSGTSNAMAALEKTGNNFLTDIRTLLVVAIAVSITYAGFRLLIGSKESKRAAKEDIPSILAGALLVAGAVVLATWVVGNIAF